jgi:hypothetical protein
VLVSTHNGAVEHRVFVVGLGSQVFEQAQPYAMLGPAAEAPMNILPVAERLQERSRQGIPARYR